MNIEAKTTALSNSLDCENFSHASRSLKKRKKTLRKWNTSFETLHVLVEPSKVYSPNIDGFLDSEICTSLDSFLKLFSSDLLKVIVRQTIIYAKQRGNINFSLTKQKLLCFIETLIVSEYQPVPFRRLYWSNQADVYNHLVGQSIRRNRFEKTINTHIFLTICKLLLGDIINLDPCSKKLTNVLKQFLSAQIFTVSAKHLGT